jgi:hypothetical protein
MSVYQIASKYLGGEFAETNGLGVHDAVHVLATTFQVSKPELRAAIYSLLEEDVVVEEQPVDGSTNAVVEGGDIDEEFFKNFP